jgi:D,D-heptose 1,7-bisphosphate phosphatase
MREAVILAGGKGTRLNSILEGKPKPLVEICGKPLLEYQIQILKKYGFIKIHLLLDYEGIQIEEFIKKNNYFDINIYFHYDGVPLGTAGSLLNILEFLSEEFLVVYGDTMFNIDIDRFYKKHNENSDSLATIFVHPNDHPLDSDIVKINSKSEVVSISAYPHKDLNGFKNLVNAALYIFRKTKIIDKNKTFVNKDIAKHLFPALIIEGKKIIAYNSPEYIKDIGTPDRLFKVENHLKSGRIKDQSLAIKQKAIFIDRDGTINIEKNHLSNIDEFEIYAGVHEAIKILNNLNYKVIVITNQPVIARGECTIQELENIHGYLEYELGKNGAFLDKIYYCPHHPDSGFENEIKHLKINCDCRKPNIGLIKKAVDEFNIDLKQSWFIGDTTTDIKTAINASLKSILVQTGLNGLDGKYNVYPDFVSTNLLTAVNFITNSSIKIKKELTNLLVENNISKYYFVGGNSRSGKSTFSSILKFALIEKGYNTTLINLDRWILDKEKRGTNFISRYDFTGVYEIINKIIDSKNTIEVQLPFYCKENKNPNPTLVKLNTNDIFIFEGTIALLVARNLNLKENIFKIFIDINENIRKKRVISEYIQRGYSDHDASIIYNDRLNDEVSIINSFIDDAFIYNLETNII